MGFLGRASGFLKADIDDPTDDEGYVTVGVLSKRGFSVLDYGADPTGVADSYAAFVAALAAAYASSPGGGGLVVVPPGQYKLSATVTVPARTWLRGAGMDNTVITNWFTDVTPIKLNGASAMLSDMTIYAKGENSDSTSFGASATTYALHVLSATDGCVSRVKLSGGYAALKVESVDCTFFDTIALKAYGPKLVDLNGANWFYRSKWDHTANSGTVGARPWAARANSTAYVVGDTRYATGPDGNSWGILCKTSGTSGGSAPTLLNYGRTIQDGTCQWELVAPVTYAGVMLSGDNVGENSFFQLDLSGPYEYSGVIDDDGAGASYIQMHNAICSAPISVLSGQSALISQSRLTGIAVDAGYAGQLQVLNNHGIAAWNITVGAGVSNFQIGNNDVYGGAITVAVGASDNYDIWNNNRATVTDGGTGTNKRVQIGAVNLKESLLYETGNWTPAITFDTAGDLSVAYSAQVGSYIRIGKLIIASFNVVTSSFTHSTASGLLRLSGLPVASRTLSNDRHNGALVFQGINRASRTQVTPEVQSNKSFMYFQASGMGVAVNTIAVADVASGGTVVLNGTIMYEAAAGI